jgi:uncharacterized membrane protein YgcG
MINSRRSFMNARRASIGLFAAFLAAVANVPLSAQAGSSPWLAFLGCWEATPGAAEEPMLCIVPTPEDAGVEMVAVANGQVLSRESVRADGQMQASSRDGCSGWERARFSADGRRVYLDAEHTCGSVRQQSSGLLAMVSRTEWIDVRAVEVGGQPATGVIHYTLAPSNVAEAAGFGNIAADQVAAVRAARISAANALTVDDVIDAHGFVGSSVVSAWIAAKGQPFQLDADRLVRMADAGVAPEVIDVVVAISYPRYFSVGANAQVAQNDRRALDPDVVEPGLYGYGGRGVFWNPFYRGYGSYYGNYYGDYYGGYGARGYYGYPGIYQPTVIVVEQRDPEPQGRLVNGRGYTRPGRSSNPGSGSSSSSGGSSSSSSSGGEGSSSGSSGGGSGTTSTGRTAQPRNPGR